MPKSKIILVAIVAIFVVGLIVFGVNSQRGKVQQVQQPSGTGREGGVVAPARERTRPEVPVPPSVPGAPGEVPGERPAGPEPGVSPGETGVPSPGEGTEPTPEPVVPQIPAWQNPETPSQSPQLSESDVPKDAIRLNVTSGGFSPSSFEVKRGQKVTVSLTAKDEWMHAFRFKDAGLLNVGVTVSSGETRAITFYAPKTSGEYEFSCNIPGHEGRGEKGKMVVE